MNEEMIFSIRKQLETPFPDLMKIGGILEIVRLHLHLAKEDEASNEIEKLINTLMELRNKS